MKSIIGGAQGKGKEQGAGGEAQLDLIASQTNARLG